VAHDATCPAPAESREATAHGELSHAELLFGCRPSVVQSVRLALVTEPQVDGESRCLGLPRIASGVLKRPGCDSLHRPGYRVLLPLPGERTG
jgi:hypothetical protein